MSKKRIEYAVADIHVAERDALRAFVIKCNVDKKTAIDRINFLELCCPKCGGDTLVWEVQHTAEGTEYDFCYCSVCDPEYSDEEELTK